MMSENLAMSIFLTGLIVVAGAVGFIEASITDTDLALGVVTGAVGCGAMWLAVPTLSDC
jgi:hypothetical protein